VAVEAGAGRGSYFADDDYAQAGAALVASTAELWAQAEVVVKVRPPLPTEIELSHPGSSSWGSWNRLATLGASPVCATAE